MPVMHVRMGGAPSETDVPDALVGGRGVPSRIDGARSFRSDRWVRGEIVLAEHIRYLLEPIRPPGFASRLVVDADNLRLLGRLLDLLAMCRSVKCPDSDTNRI